MINICIIVLLSITWILAIKSWRARIVLFSCFLFFSISFYFIPLTSDASTSIRLPLGFLLISISISDIFRIIAILKKKRILVLLILWVLYNIFELIIGNYPSAKITYEILGNFFFFILAATYFGLASEKEFRTLLVVFSVSLLPGMLLLSPQIIIQIENVGFNFSGSTYHQQVGYYSVLLFPLLLLCTTIIRSRILTIFSYFAIILCLTITIIVGARTPLIALILILFLWRRSLKWYIFLAILTPALLYITEIQISSITTQRYERIMNVVSTGNVKEEGNLDFRVEHYKIGYELFLESPIIGHGFGGWLSGSSRLMNSTYSLSTHSDWIVLMVNYGLIGIILFTFLIWRCSKGLPKRLKNTFIERYGYVIWLQIIGSLVISFAHTNMIGRPFYLLLALASVYNVRRNRYFHMYPAIMSSPNCNSNCR